MKPCHDCGTLTEHHRCDACQLTFNRLLAADILTIPGALVERERVGR